MVPKKHITLKIFFFLGLIDCLEAVAQLLYKKTALLNEHLQIQALSDVWHFCTNIISAPYFWLGTVCVFFIFVMWSTIISKIDLSVAVPATSLNFVTVPLVSIIFLHETVSPLRWIGIIIILVGVVIVSLSSHEKGVA
jgi:drug/metabolite transporter (DMT)-like permease